MSDGFLKLNRKASEYLIEHEPECFLLITQIALRARRIKKVLDSPDICQALIGDYIKCGLTRQQYRTALKKLETMKIITIKSTNKGSIVTLLDKRIYDINAEDEQPTDSPKSNQQATNEQPLKKNEEGKNEENKNKDSFVPLLKKPKAERKISFTDEDMKLSKLLDSLMFQNNPNRKEPTEATFRSWANEFRLMRERDKRSVADIEVVLRWSQNDSFWKSNIESAGKLRLKFDQLSLKMKSIPKQKGVDNAEEWNDNIDKRRFPIDIE